MLTWTWCWRSSRPCSWPLSRAPRPGPGGPPSVCWGSSQCREGWLGVSGRGWRAWRRGRSWGAGSRGREERRAQCPDQGGAQRGSPSLTTSPLSSCLSSSAARRGDLSREGQGDGQTHKSRLTWVAAGQTGQAEAPGLGVTRLGGAVQEWPRSLGGLRRGHRAQHRREHRRLAAGTNVKRGDNQVDGKWLEDERGHHNMTWNVLEFLHVCHSWHDVKEDCLSDLQSCCRSRETQSWSSVSRLQEFWYVCLEFLSLRMIFKLYLIIFLWSLESRWCLYLEFTSCH